MLLHRKLHGRMLELTSILRLLSSISDLSVNMMYDQRTAETLLDWRSASRSTQLRAMYLWALRFTRSRCIGIRLHCATSLEPNGGPFKWTVCVAAPMAIEACTCNSPIQYLLLNQRESRVHWIFGTRDFQKLVYLK